MKKSSLVIAEKTSVAQAISAVLGANQRKEGYLEGNGYIVSWCVGHLIQLAAPDAYDAKYDKWRREDLPILPERWQYTISPSTKKQFGNLKALLKRTDVTEVVNACDAGREGELIFGLVYEMCGCRKPIQRLWISSLEESAIRQGFQSLVPGSHYDTLYQAALCRARADWLVGLNITRLLSVTYGQTLSVGRVMTPTLAMITRREAEIAAFSPEAFYTVELDCGSFTASSERYSEPADAQRVAALCNSRNSVIRRVERGEKTEKPPKLYDLTALQRDANRLNGLTAQQTLDFAQSLYEKKLITYPRTDSRYLPEGMRGNALAVLDAVASALPFARELPPVHDVAQILDDGKVTDHHAVIPVSGIPLDVLESLPRGENTILTLLMERLLCAVGAPHQYAETTVRLSCEDVSFTAKGKQVLQEGWHGIPALFHTSEKEDKPKEPSLPVLCEGEQIAVAGASVKHGQTSPGKHFTENTLLAAMERAGNADAPEDAEHMGIGTPATRAATIEKLVSTGFMERKGSGKAKHLLPTRKGVSLVAVAPEAICSQQLTAEWEQQLKRVERGELPPDAFMAQITDMLCAIVRDYERIGEANTLFPPAGKIGRCPRCNGNIVERPKGFFCDNASCGLAFWKNNYFFAAQDREMTADFVRKVLTDGRVLMRGLRSQKTHYTYDAYLVFDPASEKNARFKIELVKKGGRAKT